MERREFIQGVAALAASVRFGQLTVPNSAGTRRPRHLAPAGACDCHHHIYDRERFAPQPSEMPFVANGRVEEYLQLKARLGTTRSVVVQPAPYIDDNSCTLDAIRRMSPNAVGVGVVRPTVTDAALKALETGGIRGIRFSVNDPRNKAVTMDMLEPLAARIANLGWHIQLNMTADQIVAAASILSRLPIPVVFDHMGNIPPSVGVTHPAIPVIVRLVEKQKAWVKLSATFGNTVGPPYSDLKRVADVYVKAAPERLVWGSNWPHPTEPVKPDDAVLFDLLSDWAPDDRVRHRILVENPQVLYRFPEAVSIR